MRKEPALVYGVVSALLMLLMAYGLVDTSKADAWRVFFLAIFPLIQAWLTRGEVMPVTTINEAGLTVEEVKDRAADPNVPKV